VDRNFQLPLSGSPSQTKTMRPSPHPQSFNSLSRDHARKDSSCRTTRYSVAFNSLSRDHDHIRAAVEEFLEEFLTFNSLSRDH